MLELVGVIYFGGEILVPWAWHDHPLEEGAVFIPLGYAERH